MPCSNAETPASGDLRLIPSYLALAAAIFLRFTRAVHCRGIAQW
jgi:hypothetical protein